MSNDLTTVDATAKVDYVIVFTRPDCTEDATDFAEELMGELQENGLSENSIYLEEARVVEDRILNINEVTVAIHKKGTPENEFRMAYLMPKPAVEEEEVADESYV